MIRLAALLALALSVAAGGRAESTLRFVDIAAEAGVSAEIRHGGSGKQWIAEANGSGAAALDFDNDGWMDLVIASGASMEDLRTIVKGESPRPGRGRLYLYRNTGGGRFVDVTEASGLDSPYWPTGVTAADFDNDGAVDIFVTAIGRDSLFRGAGDGTFVEIGAEAGLLATAAWHTGAAFGDYDADGDLDLYVTAYLDLAKLPVEGDAPVCRFRGLDVFCGPLGLTAAADTLYRNAGDGTFEDVSVRSGVGRVKPSYGFTPVWEDLDQDGDLDLFVSNDSEPNFFFRNEGDGVLEEDALAAGLAYNADGSSQSDMGVAVGDYDGDGDVDIFTTTFSDDYFPLFQQQWPGFFEDVAFRAGLVEPTTPLLGWSAGFADLDNDGDLDLWTVNGHVYPTAGELSTTEYHQAIVVFENRDGKFAPATGATPAPRQSYRGGLAADFDNDGRVDLLAVPVDGSPTLLANRRAASGSWVGVSLHSVRTNVEAVGARVEIAACGKQRSVPVRSRGGYASRDDPRAHFGLGACTMVDEITVTWPDGKLTKREKPAVDSWITVRDTQP